jgi:cobalt-zinc-cadmium resistance protein CzcA
MSINRLIELSVRQKGMFILLTLVAAVFGWYSLKSLPIDAVPDITNVQVQVNTQVSGMIPEEIERFITFPIESALGGLPSVEDVRSISRFGLSQVTIVFHEGSDLFRARQLVAERLQGIRESLPEGISPELGPITTGLGEVYFYSLEAKEKAEGAERLLQLMELRAFNEWSLKPRLLTVPGVAEVNAIGGYEKQYHVQPNLKKMAQYGIHLDEIVEALKHNNRNTGGGYIQQTAEQLLVQVAGLIKSPDDIKNVVVRRLPGFETLTVGDLAVVQPDREMRTGAAVVNGEEAVVGTALMLLGGNSRTISKAIHEKITDIKKTLPDWIELETLYDRSELVDRTLNTVWHNLAYGAGLVAVVLILILGNLRAALITAFVIPISLLTTFILMNYFGVSGNLMSLGALDFGIIIDGAVIVLDNCIRKLASKRAELNRTLDRQEIQEEVIKATQEIRSAAGFGQLIIIIVFLPIFALTGVEAKMFVPMAATFAFALASSFIFSFTTVPALAGMFLSGNSGSQNSPVMRLLEAIYRPMIKGALKIRWIIVAVGFAAIFLGIWLFKDLGADFLPQLDEGSIAIQFVRPTNISLDQSVALQEISEKTILEFEEVERVISRIGTAEIATDPMGPNLSDTYILLKPTETWPKSNGRHVTKAELVQNLKQKLEESVPGQTLIFSQPIQLRFNELLEGVRSDVALKIYGDDMEQLSDLGKKAATIIQGLKGAGDVESETKGTSPVLRIEPKYEMLHALGLAKENVLETVEIAIGGTPAGSLYEGARNFPIIVRLNDSERAEPSILNSLPVGAAEMLTVPLEKVANISIQETFSDIRRESAKRRMAVLINVRGRDVASFVADARQAIEKNLKIPDGYYLEWGGTFENLEAAQERLMLVVPMALVAVFILIYLAFRSFTQTVLIFLCVPMALVGGVAGLIFNGLNFSISAAIGFVALSGIAVLNGIVLISYLNKLKLEGLTGQELIMKGTLLRLRPVVMTATAAAFGFLPMMMATGAGAEVQRPLASVVVGGIISATFLTLFVLPSLYRILENRMHISENAMSH